MRHAGRLAPSSQSSSHWRGGGRGQAHFSLFLLLVVVLGSLFVAAPGQARLRPYYVVEGAGFAEVRPRILFVLDTSGSMNWKSQAAAEQCKWSDCENGSGAEQSRIAAAREALLQVVTGIGDVASFSLMTFEHFQAPTSMPGRCDDGRRFQWSDWYGYFDWDYITNYSGYFGTWRLCDDPNHPYPYLRWDELGVGSVISSNNQTGPVPPSPLISTVRTNMKSATNANRRVQWFPKFMGVRTQLNATTDPDKSILYATIGDWGTTSGTKNSNVWGHDFYYWPYVDGFPGYAAFVAWPSDRYPQWLGVTEVDWGSQSGSLYAPFYLDLSSSSVPADEWGPSSPEESIQTVRWAASPMIEGGVDAIGDTPWASAIGDIPITPPMSNDTFSHSTVASYLKFVKTVDTAGACAPLTTVLITDGLPNPASEGGQVLHERLAALRNDLSVKTYVVGFFLTGSELNNMACAAAGACDGTCTTPCDDTPSNDWDTCANPDDPGSACAFLASSVDELASVLSDIVTEEIATEIGSGMGSRINDFGVGEDGNISGSSSIQTEVTAHTEWPSWRGHVVRSLCTAEDPENPGELAPWCQDSGFSPSEVQETFGPCPQSRSWDAGACLQMTSWSDRRIYSHDSSNTVYRITNADGTATETFREELDALGLLPGVDPQAEADAIAAFVLGKDWPSGWKLPGLASSAPVVVRRIPKHQPMFAPSIPIRDPHCAGRILSEADADSLPTSLVDFAKAAWNEDEMLESPSPHYEYQEAVLVGDDLGVLHAFQFDSGNELWGFLPRALLDSAVAQYKNGTASMGQPTAVEDHIYGISSTVNEQWIFDGRSADPEEHRWLHLGVFGLGAGGTELYALDLSHMSPASSDGPFELLWTTEDTAHKAFYDGRAGETWARPAVGFEVPSNSMSQEPTARLIFGTGYSTDGSNGRSFIMADALTGDPIEYADIIVPATRYGDYGTVADLSVSSHCISRFWPEMQEVYAVDPAGQLFRWDLGNDHEADSGEAWGTQARAVTQFFACQGTGATCTVSAGTRGDVFTFGPAVSANNRIDDPGGAPSGDLPPGVDQFLVALASGSPADDDIDGRDSTNDFHSSLYLLVDDHSSGDPNGGWNIPTGAPKMSLADIGSEPGYLRLAVSDLVRTRTYTPFEGSPTYTETAAFSKATRPIRPPRIEISGVVDNDSGEVIDGVEVYRVTYTLYEPGIQTCDVRWYDPAEDLWHYDEGSVFEITLRLTAIDGQGFDFTTGASGGGADFGDGFTTGLMLESVTQANSGDCADGNCGPKPSPPVRAPCNENEGAEPNLSAARAGVPSYNATISGFSPVE